MSRTARSSTPTRVDAPGVADPSAPAPETTRATRLPRGERRNQLLDAARAVFVRSGYHAAAMDDIAERAGVSKPVLYQHFPGKLELYVALLDTSCEALIAAVEAALVPSTDTMKGDNKARVHATMQAYFEFVADPDGAFQLVFESDVTSNPEVRSRLIATEDACATLVSHVLAADTGLPPAEAMVLAGGLTGMANTAARRWMRDPGSLDRRTAADLVASLVWRGMRGFPLQPPPG